MDSSAITPIGRRGAVEATSSSARRRPRGPKAAQEGWSGAVCGASKLSEVLGQRWWLRSGLRSGHLSKSMCGGRPRLLCCPRHGMHCFKQSVSNSLFGLFANIRPSAEHNGIQAPIRSGQKSLFLFHQSCQRYGAAWVEQHVDAQQGGPE